MIIRLYCLLWFITNGRIGKIMAKGKYSYPKMEYNFFELKLGDLKELFRKTDKKPSLSAWLLSSAWGEYIQKKHAY